jgi:hypothetical protein
VGRSVEGEAKEFIAMTDKPTTPAAKQVPGPFDLSPDIAKRHPTGCGPGESYADRDRRLYGSPGRPQPSRLVETQPKKK